MFSLVQKIAFFDDFISRNTQQIEIKARSLSFQKDEIKSELFILISEKLCQFDPALGSAEAFFFSRLHTTLSRFNRDTCRNAISLDDSHSDASFLAEVENKLTQTAQPAACLTHTSNNGIVPGAADLTSLAEAASGKSTQQIANELRISRRRVNQILKRKRDIAVAQSGFDF